MKVVHETSLPLPEFRRGKVREVYEVGDDKLLLVTSDRISAFDVVLDQAIPYKGIVLTQLSAYWFRHFSNIKSHFISADIDEIIREIPSLADHRDELAGRSTLVTRTDPVMFECVVRGYLSGSAWKEYSRSGTLAGEPLTPGMIESEKLEPPIFSPATKAIDGHDENVTFDRMKNDLGEELATRLRDLSMNIYSMGREVAAERGIIIADTKFEFGMVDGEIYLIDEVLTPDSSRFWPADRYEPGRGQPSFDKQPLRDYLAGLKESGDWDGDSTPPALSPSVIEETSMRYRKAYELVAGEPLSETW